MTLFHTFYHHLGGRLFLKFKKGIFAYRLSRVFLAELVAILCVLYGYKLKFVLLWKLNGRRLFADVDLDRKREFKPNTESGPLLVRCSIGLA